jgi:hypothetical protein
MAMRGDRPWPAEGVGLYICEGMGWSWQQLQETPARVAWAAFDYLAAKAEIAGENNTDGSP